MISVFFRHNILSAVRYYKTKRVAKVVTTLLFLCVFLGIAISLFIFFRDGFLFIQSFPFLAPAVSLYVYELFFLIIGILVFVSALISGIFGFFKNEKIAWLMASPQYKTMPVYTLLKILLSSLWPLILIALPALLAIKEVFGLGVLAFFIMIISIIFLTAFAVFMAMVVLLGVSKLLYSLNSYLSERTLTLRQIILGVSLIFLILVFFIWYYISRLDIVALFQPLNLQATVADVGLIVSQFRIFPSHFSALALFRFGQGSFTSGFLLIIPLLILCLTSGLIFWAFSFWYLPLWQTLQEGRFKARTRGLKASQQPTHFPRYLKGPQGALFEKEALTTYRNSKNVLWFGFILFIWIIQVVLNLALRADATRHGLEYGSLPAILQALQVITILYFISAFVLRFGFPSFSMEKKTFWIIFSAPINLVRLFWTKLIFYSVCFTLLGLLFGLANASILAIPFLQSILFLIIIITAVISVTTFGLGLGAIFPNFETDDPETLSTSLPGLFFILLSLIYGGFGAFSFYSLGISGSLIYFIMFEIVSLLLISLIILVATRKLPNIELADN